MIRRFVHEDAKNWDKWLKPLLFAVRKVPQSSTGFSPFELLRQTVGVCGKGVGVAKSKGEEPEPGGRKVGQVQIVNTCLSFQ